MLRSGLNATAFVGWGAVGAMTLAGSAAPSKSLLRLTLALQGICGWEVAQILLGLVRGDAVLGVLLHSIRFSVLAFVFPSPTVSPKVTRSVLLAWAATELCRYPMFLWPAASWARQLRYAAPVVTFPIGAGMEAVGAYAAIPYHRGNRLVQALLGTMVVVNVLGGIAKYPALVAKAMKAFKRKERKPDNE